MTPVLQCDGVGVRANGKWLLRDVSLDINQSEIVALVGPNGAGKSTLMAVLAGDIPPAAGTVHLAGKDLSGYRPKDLSLQRAVLPQQAIVQFAFTAREIVEMGRSPQGDFDADKFAVDRSISRTDTTILSNRIFPSLSIGEQARVSLARVLAQEAPLLLLDEPTAALDLRHQQIAMDIARELAEAGSAIVVILHDLNLAAAFADRIVILQDGRIAADGPPGETLTEAVLAAVFECDISVTTHPVSGKPLVLPLTSRPTHAMS